MQLIAFKGTVYHCGKVVQSYLYFINTDLIYVQPTTFIPHTLFWTAILPGVII